MDFEGLMFSEISQTEKDKYCMIAPVETANRIMVTRAWGGGGGGEILVKGYKFVIKYVPES